MLIKSKIITNYFTLKIISSKVVQPLSVKPNCKINKIKTVETKGAAGNWLFNFLIEIVDHVIIFLLAFDSGFLFDFGGNPSSCLLLASPIFENKKRILE